MTTHRPAEQPLATLFERLRPRLLAAGRRLLGSDDDARDALQDTFMKLWRCKSEPNEGTVVTAMRNVCIDTLRRRRPSDEITETVADQASRNEEHELFDEVNSLIMTVLSERDRSILLMRDRDGFDLEAIALRTGLTEANVRVILSRARRTIREIYRQRLSKNS